MEDHDLVWDDCPPDDTDVSTLSLDPETLTVEYLATQRKIAALEGKSKFIKERLVEVLPGGVPTDGSSKEWEIAGAKVAWVKGRKSSRLDQGRLKKELVLGGIDIKIVTEAFDAATTSSVGQPHLRISAAGAEFAEE